MRLKMLASPKDYITREHDPLPYYYYPLVGNLYRRRVEMCLDLLPGGKDLLEIGFGSGVSFLSLKDLYTNIHGIDLDADCQKTSAHFEAMELNVTLRNASVLSIPYPDAHFDTVLAISILEHLKPEEQPLAMQEIRRILRHDGVFIYGVPIDNRLMHLGLQLLCWNKKMDVNNHHFSDDKMIFAAAEHCFQADERRKLTILNSGFMPMYEACRFINKPSG